uniref:Resistance protein PSH-RGH7 n=1 Tax=Solanum tuberosum TaxID=4113 RepID=M1CP25_SOLTU
MAYAAITCLMSTIQQSIQLTGCDLQSFNEKLESLRANLEKPIGDLEALISLEAEIIEVVCTTEHFLDSESRNVKNPISQIIASWKFHHLLEHAVGDIDSRVNKWMKMQKLYTRTKDVQGNNSALASTSQHVVEPEDNYMMVGHENELEMMQDQLARGGRELEVVSIVGIGKTTLANKIYNDPFIMSHFDIRAKATVSQEYCEKNVCAMSIKMMGN